MSIIIHHNEPQIDRGQIEALRKFYECEQVIPDWNFENIPEKTVALLRMEPHLICHLEEQPQGIRMISLNTAFAEMANHIAKLIDDIAPGSDSCNAKLREFLAQHRGEIFTMHDVIMFLDISPDSDQVFCTNTSITKSLEQLGCSKEHMTVFTPPPAPQQIKQRFVSREEIVT